MLTSLQLRIKMYFASGLYNVILGVITTAVLEAIIIGLVIVIIIVIAFLVFLARTAAHRLLRPPRKVLKWKPSDLGFNYGDVIVETADGLKLKGWIIPRGSDKTVLVLHGYTSSKYDEDYIKPVIEILARNGFNVVAFDFRAHGESDGELTTLGIKETEDMIGLIDWLEKNRPDLTKNIGVIGYSMGGAISIMLAARDKRVKAVVADSPYMDVVASGKRWIMRIKGFMRSLLLLIYPLIISFAKSKANIDLDKLKVYNYAEKVDQPILIIAGERDDLVTLDEIKKFYNLLKKHNNKVEIWIVDSKHVEAIKDHPKEYEEKVVGFFRRWL